MHDKFIKDLEKQRPDEVLRQRSQSLLIAANQKRHSLQYEGHSSSEGLFFKLTHWAVTASVGTMALLLASKKWV